MGKLRIENIKLILLIVSLSAIMFINSCSLATGKEDSDTLDEISGVTISLKLQNSGDSRGHWGIFAWIMDESGNYVDTLEYYKFYDSYSDSGSAGNVWISDGGSKVDGISSATKNVTKSDSEVYNSIPTWDGKNSSGGDCDPGKYTIKLVIPRHTSSWPYFTTYQSIIEIGGEADSALFVLTNGTDSAVFPYDVLDLEASTVVYNP